MAAHNYIASPVLTPGAYLQRQAPVRTELDVSDDFATGGVTRETWAFEPIVDPGPPPRIEGYFCVLEYSQVITIADVTFTCEPQAMTVPTTVDGQPVVAVALHVNFDLTWERFAVGYSGGSVRDEEQPCGSADTGPSVNPGPSHFELFVDDTQVVRIDGAQSTSGPGPGCDFIRTLILPEDERDLTFPIWNVAREPFDAGILTSPFPFPFSYYFFSDSQVGESLPVEISFEETIAGLRMSSVGVAGFRSPPSGLTHTDTILTSIDCWVDVYPYIEIEPEEANLMMVV